MRQALCNKAAGVFPGRFALQSREVLLGTRLNDLKLLEFPRRLRYIIGESRRPILDGLSPLRLISVL